MGPHGNEDDSMSDFRRLNENVLVSPQLALEDIAAAAALGVTTIVNNRPDGEEPSAPQGDAIEAAAAAVGLNYVAIPIGHSGFSEPQVDAMIAALEQAEGPILAYLPFGHALHVAMGARERQAGRRSRDHRPHGSAGGL